MLVGLTTMALPDTVDAAPGPLTLDAGDHHVLAIDHGGQLQSWGSNDCGKLGLGIGDRYVPYPQYVDTAHKWAAVSAGWGHSLAIRRDGSLWAWGANYYGQLGLGDRANRNKPTRVGTRSDWVAVLAGYQHSLALAEDGSLWSWGRNHRGQLGYGNKLESDYPRQVGGSTSWRSLGQGVADHSVAVRADGSLWAWGANSYGQLGVGDRRDRLVPTRVGAVPSWNKAWVEVALGSYHTLAVRRDGTLWSWGANSNGQLGLGDTALRVTPKRVGKLTTWTTVGAAWRHSVATRRDGSLWAWGRNQCGQLGIGSTAQRRAPRRVSLAKRWVVASAGGWYTVAMERLGGVYTCGTNEWGQLGVNLAKGVWRSTFQETNVVAGDMTPPVTTVVLDPAPNANGWNGPSRLKNPENPSARALIVAFQARDERNTIQATYTVSPPATSWRPTGHMFLDAEWYQGISTYYYYSVDVAGNVEHARRISVRIDTHRPVPSALDNVTVRSGARAALRYRINDISPTCKVRITIRDAKGKVVGPRTTIAKAASDKNLTWRFACTLPRGTYKWYVAATDLAGNKQTTASWRYLRVR